MRLSSPVLSDADGLCRNILPIPFRRTHAVLLSDALKQYISNKYDQHPDMFKHDLEAIDTLRVDAVTSLEAHTSGIRKLSAYAAQLVWIGGKFPIDVRCALSTADWIELSPSQPKILTTLCN